MERLKTVPSIQVELTMTSVNGNALLTIYGALCTSHPSQEEPEASQNLQSRLSENTANLLKPEQTLVWKKKCLLILQKQFNKHETRITMKDWRHRFSPVIPIWMYLQSWLNIHCRNPSDWKGWFPDCQIKGQGMGRKNKRKRMAQRTFEVSLPHKGTINIPPMAQPSVHKSPLGFGDPVSDF